MTLSGQPLSLSFPAVVKDACLPCLWSQSLCVCVLGLVGGGGGGGGVLQEGSFAGI